MVAIIVFIMMIFDAIMGSPLPANDETFASFSIFHDCMSKMPFDNVHESCRNSEGCLDDLFDKADDYLSPKAEIRAKLEVKHELDNLKQDCNNMGDIANNQLSCQLNGIKLCLNSAHANQSNDTICNKLFTLRECLGPFELGCRNRIFASILGTISFGIWESNSCSLNSNSNSIITSTEKTISSVLSQMTLMRRYFKHNTTKTMNEPYAASNPIAKYRIFNMKSRSLNLVKVDDVNVLNDNISKVDRSFHEDVADHSGSNCTNSECNENVLDRSKLNSARDFTDIPEFIDESILTTNNNNNNNNSSDALNKGTSNTSQFVIFMSLLIGIVYL